MNSIARSDAIRRVSVTPTDETARTIQRLHEARLDMIASLKSRDEACIEPTADDMDKIQAAVARELAAESLNRRAHRLREIEDALSRMKNGEYGICTNCGEQIGAKRLQAIPWAALCLACQEIVDQSDRNANECNAVPVLSNAA